MNSEDVKLAITIFGFAISIGTLIWKMSALNAQVKENTKDISGIGNKLNKLDEKCEKRGCTMEQIAVNIARIQTTITEKRCLFHNENIGGDK